MSSALAIEFTPSSQGATCATTRCARSNHAQHQTTLGLLLFELSLLGSPERGHESSLSQLLDTWCAYHRNVVNTGTGACKSHTNSVTSWEIATWPFTPIPCSQHLGRRHPLPVQLRPRRAAFLGRCLGCNGHGGAASCQRVYPDQTLTLIDPPPLPGP